MSQSFWGIIGPRGVQGHDDMKANSFTIHDSNVTRCTIGNLVDNQNIDFVLHMFAD